MKTPSNGVIERVLVGGNHLATQLIELGAGDMPNKFDSYQTALSANGELYADIWVAWRAIMDLSKEVA